MKKSIILLTAILFALSGFVLGADDFKVKESNFGDARIEYADGEVIVKFKSGITAETINRIYTELGASEIYTSPRAGFKRIAISSLSNVDEAVEQFRARADVEYAEPNYILRAFMTPNDPYYTYQWHMPKINAEPAWDLSTGTGIVVAIIDCGVAYENYGSFGLAPDLAGTNFVPGYDFVNNDTHPNDDNGHGTHVAGTVAQTTNNNLGVAGVAFNSSIMPIKVLDASGNGWLSDVADGIIWAADNGAQVINMSLGSSSSTSTLQNAVRYADGLGVTIVCAAGNSGNNVPQYPASYVECISVSATRYDDTRPSYSSFGSNIDICAPGGDTSVDQNGDGYVDGVLQQTFGTTYTDWGYWFYQGTSMASPHVAGVSAMLLAVDGSLTPQQVRSAMEGTAVDLGSAGWDQFYGFGLVDAYAAIQSLTPPTNPPVADFSGTPTSGQSPLTVQFTDLSTENPTSWNWDFGDGGISTAQNPSYEYISAGTFSVSLTAANAYGSDSEVKTGYITITAPSTDPPAANFSATPTSGQAPLTVQFTDLSTENPTSWNWDFGDGGISTAQNPSYEYISAGAYTVSLTAANAYGSDTKTKVGYINVTEASAWTVITYDDFEGGMGNYTDGGRDMTLYARGTYAHQGNNAADIQDNSGVSSSFYHTSGYDVSGYTELEVEFWFYAVSMEANEDFWVQYYDGSGWQTVATFAQGNDFQNNQFYNEVVAISSAQYNFPTDARLRFMCDASGNRDDVYIDEIEFRGSGVSGLSKPGNPASEILSVPGQFALQQNFPNPFNAQTTIRYNLEEASLVHIEIFNLLGQSIITLVAEYQPAGTHRVTWNAEDQSSGVYLYSLRAGQLVETKRMLLLK